MKKAAKLILSIEFFIYFILSAGTASAAGSTPICGSGGTSLTGLISVIMANKNTSYTAILDLIPCVISSIINMILYIIPSVALIMTIWSGIQYMFSAGNPSKQGAALKSLNASVLGFAAFLVLLALWEFIKAFFGIKISFLGV